MIILFIIDALNKAAERSSPSRNAERAASPQTTVRLWSVVECDVLQQINTQTDKVPLLGTPSEPHKLK
ncbi:MAG: hypothetical protein JST20_11070 [Bacteroidetes bacterium]|nr:hypothetical protein [Bacteroidota bacterium]